MNKYTKKPITIEAVRWDGNQISEVTPWIREALEKSTGSYPPPVNSIIRVGNKIHITTLEGEMQASPGDYIIQGIQGEIYPCKPDIFEKSYSKADPLKITAGEGLTLLSEKDSLYSLGDVAPIGKVYPSEEETIFSVTPEGDEYGGAHLYLLKNNLGFSEGKSNYDTSVSLIRFVEKKQTGEMIPGIQSEQLVIALVDRIKKLNAKFPCDENDEQIACLEGYLAACKKRIDNRINRGVMGDLKK